MVISTLAPEVQASLLKQWEPINRNQLQYLVTWSTRGRRAALRERHVRALDGELRSICRERGIPLLEVCAGPDHVHVLLSLKATQSLASVVRELKGCTGMSLMSRFPELRVWLRSNLLWDERCSVEMVSHLRLEPVRARLRALHGSHEELAATG
jgi:REP element-mobilizing transposase RayT